MLVGSTLAYTLALACTARVPLSDDPPMTNAAGAYVVMRAGEQPIALGLG